MTRWLAAAKTASPPSDKIDRIDKNTPEQGGVPASRQPPAPKPAEPGKEPPDLRRDWKPDTAAQRNDAEVYATAIRVHGPMSYGMAMRRLGWGGTRAGQAEAALKKAGRIAFNDNGRAYLVSNEGGES